MDENPVRNGPTSWQWVGKRQSAARSLHCRTCPDSRLFAYFVKIVLLPVIYQLQSVAQAFYGTVPQALRIKVKDV